MNLLSKQLKTKPENKVDIKNCIYEVTCKYEGLYKGETKRHMDLRIPVHRTATQKAEMTNIPYSLLFVILCCFISNSVQFFN